MFVENNFNLNLVKNNDPAELEFWELFDFAERRYPNKYRFMVNVPFNKTGYNEHLNFEQIRNKISLRKKETLSFEEIEQDIFLEKKKNDLNFKGIKEDVISKKKRDLDDRTFILDLKYPLHKETITEQKLNNIFVDFIEKIKKSDFTENEEFGEVETNVTKKETRSSTVKLTSKNAHSTVNLTPEDADSTVNIDLKGNDPGVNLALEYLQRESMLNPSWKRSENFTFFEIEKELASKLGLDPRPFHEYWIIQKGSESSLHLYPEEKTKVCDRNHFQFKMTSQKFYMLNFTRINTRSMTLPEDIKDEIHHLAEQFITVRSPAMLWPTAIQFAYFTENCKFDCPGYGPVFHSAGCLQEQICDFENQNSCDWYFTNLNEIAEIEKREFSLAKKRNNLNSTFPTFTEQDGIQKQSSRNPENFQVVVGMVSEKNNSSNHYAYYSSKNKSSNIAMIVSPYYQHSNPHCSVSFSYRIIGEQGAFLLVSTQLIPLHAISTEEISESEAEDWTIPTQRKIIPASVSMSEPISISVPIGEVAFPTRIRIECHGNEEKRKNGINVECFVDDIKLENCQEHIWQPNVCSMEKEPKKYLCHQYKEQKCIDYSDICDMQEDCPNREDEDNKIHNCKLAPPSARCTFEETRYEAGCENWMIVNMPNSVELIRLAAVEEFSTSPATTKSSKNLVLRQTKMPLDKTNNMPDIGHYLMFSTFGDDYTVNQKFTDTGLLYSHAMTPLYPRMDPRLKDPGSKIYRTCMVRFFFCHVGSTNFQIILERIKTPYKKVIWTPPKASLVEPCEWEKASITLDYQPGEYYLKFGIAKMNNHKSMFLMDDFSLSPNCFLMKGALLESTLPPSITLTTCGLAGSTPPTAKQCENPVNGEKIDGQLPTSGRRSFMVDKKTEYRIEIYGASGGRLPNQTVSNGGGMVVVNYVFDMADEVTFVVGQMGESPCNLKQLSKKQQQITEVLCPSSLKQKSKLLPEDVFNVVGTGGGGASAVFVNGKPIAIVGGGGGTFPSEFAVPTKGRNSSQGGTSFQYISPKRSPRSPEEAQMSQWSIGNGGSFYSPQKPVHLPECSDCHIMSGQLLSPSNAKPGVCPPGKNWSLPGGFGGGGATCGSGAGGGAGYIGGLGGYRFHGEGGASAVFSPVQKFISKAGINDGNGRIVLRACTLPCVINATCRFEDPVDGQIPREYCQCHNGLRVTGSESCESALRGLAGKVKDTIEATHPKTLLSFFFILLLLLLIPCLLCILYRIYNTRKKKKAFKDFHNELQLIATDPLGMGNGAGAIVTRGSISSNGQLNLITGNPIYQYMDLLDVPHVNRDWCEFHDVIGHGAFGEVRSGTMERPGDPPFRVAIKTLPFESNPEVIHDFQTEARILSNFSHPNIVKFFGVCFDSHPKFIVLELLEGGDLKNYLRECRPKNAGVQNNQGSVSVPVSPAATITSPTGGYQLMMTDLIQMSLDVAQGCEYLENNKFVHRDIAARNCLLTSKNPLTRTVKIADFGMARDIYRNDYYRKGGRAFLPVKWMPPEAFLDGIFTSKTDTWAFGVLLWEVFSMGYTPYPGRQNQEVMQLIVSGGRLDPPVGTPDEIYSFMIRCWETASECRPSFKQVVKFLTDALKLPSVKNAPLPPTVHKMRHKMSSETPPMATRSSAPPGDNEQNNPLSTASQATISTLVTSMTESTTTSSYDSMPTKGEGVTHNICPPYEAKHPRPILAMSPLERIASGDDSISSHDDSTLHDTCSVKQSPYKIEKNQIQPAIQNPSGNNLPFHRRLFRKSIEKKTGSSQPLIQSNSSSSSTTNGQSSSGDKGRDNTPKRGPDSTPSQLL